MMSSASGSGTSTPESSRQVTNGNHLGVAETENTHRSISPAADALSLLNESSVISESKPEYSLPSNHSSASDLGHREGHLATSTPIAQRLSDVKHDINRASHLNMPEGQGGPNAYPAFNNDNPGVVATDSCDTDSAMQHSNEQLRKASASQRNRSGSNSGSISASDSPVTYNSIGSGIVSESSSDVEGECSLMSSFTQTYSDLHEVIKVPIVGFEVMEERARFTIFKIHVKISSQENWFIFRRYTDFVRLNEKLSGLFPHFRLALPPKRWFGDNYDKNFLEDRQLGLQAFLTNVTCHKDVCISKPVREFFCLNDPPGRHDTLEESKALCESLEEDAYHLQQEVEDRDRRINLLEQELELQRMEITNLKKALKSEKFGKRSSSSHSINSSTEHLTEADQQRYNGVKMRDSKDSSPFKKSVSKEKFQAEMNSPNRLSIVEISEECSSTESTSAVMSTAPTPTT